ncbi:hypothetical protein CDAR_35761 [Caerostris darwini]|uniref:Uncharacterized protein n=1 Tax=Caerostris darwini TaxID=1538125 RepID=A0AAV4VCI6_9ARAC|nr:hypothetical protein CDAR_35761 [Caerostris darwini]
MFFQKFRVWQIVLLSRTSDCRLGPTSYLKKKAAGCALKPIKKGPATSLAAVFWLFVGYVLLSTPSHTLCVRPPSFVWQSPPVPHYKREGRNRRPISGRPDRLISVLGIW